MDKRTLLRRIKEDDESAFNELYIRYFNLLNLFSYSIVNDNGVSEEIIDDVFLKLWLKRNSLPNISNEKVYLYTAVRNASLNYLRTFATKRYQAMENFLLSEQQLYIEFSPEHHYIRKETEDRINEAMNALPPKCKTVYSMIKGDGLSINEVAEILSLSYKTVFAQLQIALRKIASALNK